jgi:hypothetical protein
MVCPVDTLRNESILPQIMVVKLVIFQCYALDQYRSNDEVLKEVRRVIDLNLKLISFLI